MRSVPQQYWPVFMHEPIKAPFTARSMSASEQTIIASLPPSSSVHGISRLPQAAATFLPVAALPVNEILSTPRSTNSMMIQISGLGF